jgi:hypothetical protein
MAQEQIKQQNEETTVVSGDWFLMQKASTDETVKVDAGNIVPDGTVVPNKLMATTGSSWAWQSWTPTWTNVTIGNATVNAKYIQIGKTVHCTILMTAGSTTSFAADIFRITLPITAESRYAVAGIGAPFIGVAYYENAGLLGYHGMIQGVSTTVVQFVVAIVNGTYPTNTGVTSTVPFTWGNGDYIGGSFTYEAA